MLTESIFTLDECLLEVGVHPVTDRGVASSARGYDIPLRDVLAERVAVGSERW